MSSVFQDSDTNTDQTDSQKPKSGEDDDQHSRGRRFLRYKKPGFK